MSNRLVYILFGLVGVMLLYFVIYVFVAEDSVGEDYLFSKMANQGIKAPDITSIEIERTDPEKQKLVMTVTADGDWKLQDPFQTRLDVNAIRGILNDLLDVKLVNKKDLKGFSAYQLEKPSYQITLKKGGEVYETVGFGTVTIGGDKGVIFVRNNNSNKPLVVNRSNLLSLLRNDSKTDSSNPAELMKWLGDLRPTKILGNTPVDVVNRTGMVSLAQGKKELKIQFDPLQRLWLFVEPAYYGMVETSDTQSPSAPGLRPKNLRQFLNTVYDLQVNNAQTDYIDQPKDLKDTGLSDDQQPLQIRLQTRGDQKDSDFKTMTVFVGAKVKDHPELTYVRVSGEGSIAKVKSEPIESLRSLLSQPDSLRSRDLLSNSVDSKRIDIAEVSFANETFSLFNTGTDQNNQWYIANDKTKDKMISANASKVKQLIETVCRSNQVIGFPAPNVADVNMGFDDKFPKVTIRLWQNGVIKDSSQNSKEKDKKKDSLSKDSNKVNPEIPKYSKESTVQVMYGKESGDGIYVRVTEGKRVATVLVPKTVKQIISGTRLDYLQPSLPPFSALDVMSVKVIRDGKTVEVRDLGLLANKDPKAKEPQEKGIQEKGPQWEIVEPALWKGKKADIETVLRIISEMVNLKPIRVASEKATPEEFTRWGVDANNAKVKVILSFRPGAMLKEKTFYFGNELLPEKLNLYCKIDNEPMVFEVAKSSVESIFSNSYRDLHLYHVNEADIDSIKLTGWQDIIGTPVTRELTRSANNSWELKDKVDYHVDRNKVDFLIRDILNPVASNLVDGGPKQEQKLQLTQGALKVEIFLKDKKVITLTVGGLDAGGNNNYIQSGNTGSDVFLLPKSKFQDLKQKPKLFE